MGAWRLGPCRGCHVLVPHNQLSRIHHSIPSWCKENWNCANLRPPPSAHAAMTPPTSRRIPHPFTFVRCHDSVADAAHQKQYLLPRLAFAGSRHVSAAHVAHALLAATCHSRFRWGAATHPPGLPLLELHALLPGLACHEVGAHPYLYRHWRFRR